MQIAQVCTNCAESRSSRVRICPKISPPSRVHNLASENDANRKRSCKKQWSVCDVIAEKWTLPVNDEIARLFRLKRYEQPPACPFLRISCPSFRRRQAGRLLRQPVCVSASSAHTVSRSGTMSVPTLQASR